jgi:hypothetical protein
MSPRLQFTVGTLLLLTGLALMTFTVYALSSAPYACAAALMWLCFVEYAVAKAWLADVAEFYDEWRARP